MTGLLIHTLSLYHLYTILLVIYINPFLMHDLPCTLLSIVHVLFLL
jgi:hypothetical protein